MFHHNFGNSTEIHADLAVSNIIKLDPVVIANQFTIIDIPILRGNRKKLNVIAATTWTL